MNGSTGWIRAVLRPLEERDWVLPLSKHIVAQHGASISLESQAGKGTEIRVEFSDVLKRQMEERAENA